MALKVKIKQNDRVVVITGNDKGKIGKVLKVFPAKQRAIVEGVRFIKRHTKPSQTNQQGGIIEKEAAVNLSNIMIYCDRCSRGVKISSKLLDDGRRVRICKRCGEMTANT